MALFTPRAGAMRLQRSESLQDSLHLLVKALHEEAQEARVDAEDAEGELAEQQEAAREKVEVAQQVGPGRLGGGRAAVTREYDSYFFIISLLR